MDTLTQEIIYLLITFIIWLFLVIKTYEDNIVYNSKNGIVVYYPNKFFSLFQFFIAIPIFLYLFFDSVINGLLFGSSISLIFIFIALYILVSVIFTGDKDDE